MATSTYLLVLATALISVLLSRSPYLMSSSAPTKIWADSPMRLVTTPQFETQKTDLFTIGATHMALLHNSIIRSFNSIYNQANHVSEVDKSDFVGYALTWHRFVVSHHDDEEANLFPKVEEVLDDKTIWGETHEEHESFLGGLEEFRSYLTGLSAPSDFSGPALIGIMDSFKGPFEHHFHHEIAIIADLASHPNVPAPSTPTAEAAAAIFKTWGKKTVSKAGMTDVLPFFLMNLDRTAEGGMWANWPPMPGPIRWMMVNVVGSWYGSWWKFASCDAAGQPQELYALKGADPTEA